MNLQRLLDVLVISMPVFAVMGLGKLLAVRGRLEEPNRKFINWLVYTFALPCLIFREVAKQPFDRFGNPALVGVPLLAIVLVLLTFAVLGRWLRYRGSFAAAFTFSSFWANVTYMGFVLAQHAFGEEGLALAAIYNAFVMPAFVAMGFGLIALHHGAAGADVRRDALRSCVLNPIFLAAVSGIAVALGRNVLLGVGVDVMARPLSAAAIALLDRFLGLIGAFGLPLALLAIGASLKAQHIREHWGALWTVVAGKLVVLPLVTLLLLRVLFPDAPSIVVGVAVLLNATPNAVASYVVASSRNVAPDFVSAVLVISTALSIVTIPAWLYFLL